MKKKISLLEGLPFWIRKNIKKSENQENQEELTYDGKKIPMIGFVDRIIHFTTDLSIFKKCPYNRNEVPGASKKVLKSTTNSGWVNPLITVNSNMEVLYGQHTLDVAKKINGPVFYVISEDQKSKHLKARENSTRWNDYASLCASAVDNKNMEDVKNYYLKIRISLGKMKKTHKAITIPQLLAILYRKPEYIYGLRCNGGADLLDDLNACDINNPDVLNIIKIFSFVQKNCMPKGIKRYPALVGLTRYIFDNENTIDLDKFYNKLGGLQFKLSGTDSEYYKQVEKFYK